MTIIIIITTIIILILQILLKKSSIRQSFSCLILTKSLQNYSFTKFSSKLRLITFKKHFYFQM